MLSTVADTTHSLCKAASSGDRAPWARWPRLRLVVWWPRLRSPGVVAASEACGVVAASETRLQSTS